MAIIMGLKPTVRPFTFIVNQQAHIDTATVMADMAMGCLNCSLISVDVVTYVQKTATSIN